MDVDIVKDALEYYDANAEKYEELRNKITYIKIAKNLEGDLEKGYMLFHDKDKNILFKSRYEILGKYYEDYDVWAWAWAIPSFSKVYTSIIKKVLMYGIDIDVKDNPYGINFADTLKGELITGRMKISNEIQIEIHCAIASYLAKKPFIYKLDNTPDVNQLIDVVDPNKKIRQIHYLYILDPPF